MSDDQTPVRTFLVVVDQTEELRVALRFASRRAQHTGGRVALLYVVEPSDFHHWMAVEDLMEKESRMAAEEILNEYSGKVQEWIGETPMIYIREGRLQEELLKLIDEDETISILVLAADTGPRGPGPLVSALTGKLVSKLRIPLTIVPGNLSDEQIDALT